MKYEARPARSKQELDAILKLRYEVLRKPWDQPADTATDALEPHCYNSFITDESGKAIACGRLQENEGKTGQVRFMAVDPACQGKGLGKLILDDIERKAKEMSLLRLELQARENAVRFYESCGYRITEKTFLLWGIIQHYKMEKDIRS